jgi:hypothetical protein
MVGQRLRSGEAGRRSEEGKRYGIRRAVTTLFGSAGVPETVQTSAAPAAPPGKLRCEAAGTEIVLVAADGTRCSNQFCGGPMVGLGFEWRP